MDFLDPQTQGLLGLAQGILASSGPSRMPVPFGAALAGGFGGMQAAANNAIGNQQRQSLIGLEQQKAKLTEAQTAAALRQNAVQEGILRQLGLVPDMPPALMGQPAGVLAAPSASPQPSEAPVPALIPPVGGVLSQLPPYARTAVGLDVGLNGGKGMAGILQKSMGPQEIQGVGSVQFNPQTGKYEALPGLAEAMAAWKGATAGVENENALVEIKDPVTGAPRQVTKAQALMMAKPSNAAMNLPATDRAAILADMQKSGITDANVNMVYPNGQVKGTITGPGFQSGPSPSAQTALTEQAKAAAGIQGDIDKEAENALASKRILGEMRDLSQDFTPSKIAPFQRTLGEWAQALGLKGFDDQIKSAGSQQALQKLTAQMATAAMKQFTNRGTQMEFNTFLQNNPNAALTPEGFSKVLGFMEGTADKILAKQQAFVEWKKTHPLETAQDFNAEWNKKMSDELTAVKPQKAMDSLPPANSANNGKVIRDTVTGKRLRSNGIQWVELK